MAVPYGGSLRQLSQKAIKPGIIMPREKRGKSFILRQLGEKSQKRQKNDFTTKTLFKAADRKY